MSFTEQVNKEVETGAYQIVFHDDNKTASISYSKYEDGKAVQFVETKPISFDELAEKYPDEFASLMGSIQILCDDYNPKNPANEVVEEPIEE